MPRACPPGRRQNAERCRATLAQPSLRRRGFLRADAGSQQDAWRHVGKAMGDLESGTGIIEVLVSLGKVEIENDDKKYAQH